MGPRDTYGPVLSRKFGGAVGINLPKLKDSFNQMVEVMLGGVFFSLPISRAGGTRSCPVLPKFVARTGQTVDGISQSKSSTWFSLCILWLPILLQGSIEGSTLPWSLKTSTSGRAFGGNFQDVWVTCWSWNITMFLRVIFLKHLHANPREQVPRTWTWTSSKTMKRWIPWSSNPPLVPKTWSILSMVSCRYNHLRHAIPRLTRSSMCIHCSKSSRISKAGRFLPGQVVTTFPAGNGHRKWWLSKGTTLNSG